VKRDFRIALPLAILGLFCGMVLLWNFRVQAETSVPPTPTYVVQTAEIPATVQTPVGMCRTEDSCSVDFHGGQYTIRQVTP
jgi:hypothetical protein